MTSWMIGSLHICGYLSDHLVHVFVFLRASVASSAGLIFAMVHFGVRELCRDDWIMHAGNEFLEGVSAIVPLREPSSSVKLEIDCTTYKL